MKDDIAYYLLFLLDEITRLHPNLILLTMLVIMFVMVLDSISSHVKKQHISSGLSKDSIVVSADGTKLLPAKNYVSDIQGLAGRPDAVINENGYFIPIERKPLANKIRDRYVAQLLVYMRLIEEFEGKKPPYGYLILGANCRRVKIYNTEARQKWLQTLIDEMQYVLKGGASSPTPHPAKCKKCDVRSSCSFSMAVTPQTESHSKSVLLSKRVVH